MEQPNVVRLPKPEVRGVGTITYRCAACTEPISGAGVPAIFSDGVWAGEVPRVLTPNVLTYHEQHLPTGVVIDGR